MKRYGIILGLLVVAGALIWFAMKNPRQKEKKYLEPETGPLFNFEELNAFSLTNDKGTIKFEKDKNNWWIVQPKKVPPWFDFFDTFLANIEELAKIRVVDKEPSDLSNYGLDKPFATLKFWIGEPERVLVVKVGKINPTGDYLYAQTEGRKEVYLISRNLYMFLNKGFTDYRFRGFYGIDPYKIVELRIEIIDKNFQKFLSVPPVRHLVLQEVTTGTKTWVLVEPNQEKADDGQVNKLLGDMVLVMVAQKVIDIQSEEELTKFRLNPPLAKIIFTMTEGQTQEIDIGKEEGGFVYLTQPGRDEVLLEEMAKVYDCLSLDFRKHRFLERFEEWDRVELEYPRQNISFALEPSGEKYKWRIAGEPDKTFPQARRNWVLKPLQEKFFDKFIDENPKDLKPYGLDPPRMKVRFYSGQNVVAEIWLGDPDSKLGGTYAYNLPQKLVVWYSEDIIKEFPTAKENFIVNQ